MDENDKKVDICHFADSDGSFHTISVSKKGANRHMAKHEDDYCGQCHSERFARDSVLQNIPPAEGLEIYDTYEVEYNVTYLKTGIVSLAASFEDIRGVVCTAGTIEIGFVHPIDEEALSNMFPKHYLLAVDGVFCLVRSVPWETKAAPTLS
jgi:hypothetical protein